MTHPPEPPTDSLALLLGTVREILMDDAEELRCLRREFGRETRRVFWRHWAILAMLGLVGVGGPMASHTAFRRVSRDLQQQTEMMARASKRWDAVITLGHVLHSDDLVQGERERLLLARIRDLSEATSRLIVRRPHR